MYFKFLFHKYIDLFKFILFIVILGYIMYKRSRWNTPQALDHCSNADSIGYLDDMFKVSLF